ncbi:MFS transporter [Brevibacillus daliensis]|uniref:MFS transporter n=1 Tax=Brevibacillus daliensis TaxID=2892995 RepID=UPI001E491788|nr:MFS transporter [Brevibacillus daliensis]
MSQPANRPIVILALITALCLLGDSMLYIVLPVFFKEAGLTSIAQVGLLLSINRLIRLPLSPLVNYIYGRVNLQVCMVAAVFLSFVTTLSYGFLHSFWLWLLIRALWGFVWSILRLGAYLTIVDLATEQNRGQLTGTYNGLYRLGSLFGMLLGGFLADWYGLATTAIIFSVATLIGIPYILLTFKNPKPKELDTTTVPVEHSSTPKRSKVTIWDILKQRQVAYAMITGVLVAMLFQGILAGGVSQLFAYYYSDPTRLFGITVGVATLAGIIQSIRWVWEPWLAPWVGRLSDEKWSRSRLLSYSLIGTALCLFLIPISKPIWMMVFLLLLIQLLATSLTTLSDTYASDMAAQHVQHKGSILTSYTMSVDLGAALGPLIGLSVFEWWGPLPLYVTAAVVMCWLSFIWYQQANTKKIPLA